MLGEVDLSLFDGEYDAQHIHDLWQHRWKMLHSPMHSLAYVLDPEYVEHEDVFSEPDVSAGVQTMLERLAPYRIDECYSQLRRFRGKLGSFSKASVWERAKAMNAHVFWEMHGAELPDLRAVAMKVLSQPCTTSASERNWSTFEFIHSKKRNKLTSKRCNDLVYVFSNLRLANKLRDPMLEECVVEWENGFSSDSEDEDASNAVPAPIPQCVLPSKRPAAAPTGQPQAERNSKRLKLKSQELQAKSKPKSKK